MRLLSSALLIALIIKGASISATELKAPALAPPNEMTDRRSEDTGSPDLFAPALDQALRQFRAQANAGFQSPLQINVVFHVLSGPSFEGNLSEGNLSESVLIEQISVLNSAYQSAGLHFNLAEVRRYPDSPYFAGGCFPTTEQGIKMKSELAVDPARFVNVYTCKLQLPYIAGYGTLPNEFPEADPQHGVIIDYGTVPACVKPLISLHSPCFWPAAFPRRLPRI